LAGAEELERPWFSTHFGGPFDRLLVFVYFLGVKAKVACLLLCAAVSLSGFPRKVDGGQLVVHEWGTFTSLQDENGQAIGGINTDDEPVPKFVHRLSDFLVLRPTEIPPSYFQGAPHCHPDITMRLETPVLYFHPTESEELSNLTVRAQFHGGWLSEYFPDAQADAPGLADGTFQFGRLAASTSSSLTWTNLRVGGVWDGPPCAWHVWTAPRAVRAANVRTSGGEAERFLFYRGVAHIDAPLRIATETGELVFRGQLEGRLAAKGPLELPSLWLVDIRPDGQMAYKVLPRLSIDANQDKVLARTCADFKPDDYQSANLSKLKESLHSALVAQGLFDDEALALLNTWELSYFKSSGLRVFFLVPRPWTDFYLPLEVSAAARVERVMVGRIELVTRQQRDVLSKLSMSEDSGLLQEAGLLRQRVLAVAESGPRLRNVLYDGEESLAAAGVDVPPTYRLYLSLGRFRNALILDQMARHPTSGLESFIRDFHLEGFKAPVAAN
jgi:hypothetical protein